FFQAEDGIRDDLVTGVQTCALPISAASSGPSAERPAAAARSAAMTRLAGVPLFRYPIAPARTAARTRSAEPSTENATTGRSGAEIGRASCRERGARWEAGAV